MRVAYQSGAAIPTPIESRSLAAPRASLWAAVLASLAVHAAALSWPVPPGTFSTPPAIGDLPLQLQLVRRDRADPAPRQPLPIPSRRLTTGPALPAPVPQASSVATPPVEPHEMRPSERSSIEPVPQPDAVAKFALPDERAPIDVNPSDEAPASGLQDYQRQLRSAAARLQRYPSRARRSGIEGEAVVVLELSGASRSSVRLIRSSGAEILDRAAVELIERAVRAVGPPREGSQPGSLRFPVRYALRDGGF